MTLSVNMAHELIKRLKYRFVNAGVPLYDYSLVASHLEDGDEWHEAWTRLGDLRFGEAETAARDGQAACAASLFTVAALEYHFAKFLFLSDRQRTQTLQTRSSDSYRRALEFGSGPSRSMTIPFGGTQIHAVLREPAGAASEATRLVILIPGLDATKEELHALSETFVGRGFATLTVDGPGQGEAEFDSLLRPDWENILPVLLDTADGFAGLDTSRVAVVGVSLGGLFAGRCAVSTDPRLAAVAVVGGCYDFSISWPSLPALSTEAFVVRSGAGDVDTAAERARTFTMDTAPDSGTCPVLLVHGARDRLFEMGELGQFEEKFGARASTLIAEDGDHVLHNLSFRIRPAMVDWVDSQLR